MLKNVKDSIIKELHKTVYILGAKSDLLCITGSYGDTQTDEEILRDLTVWNKLNSTNNP